MDKKSKMFALVAQWRESGLTRTVFAQQCGIQVASFDYWCKKQYNEVVKFSDRPTPKFIELKSSIVAPDKNLSPQIELTLPSGLLIKIY
jgi:hypothetical protein